MTFQKHLNSRNRRKSVGREAGAVQAAAQEELSVVFLSTCLCATPAGKMYRVLQERYDSLEKGICA